jgi:hypothetical protein
LICKVEPVENGYVEVEWEIRKYTTNGKVEYDWIMDDGRGGYSESDSLFDSVVDAKIDLGVA